MGYSGRRPHQELAKDRRPKLVFTCSDESRSPFGVSAISAWIHPGINGPADEFRGHRHQNCSERRCYRVSEERFQQLLEGVQPVSNQVT